MTLLKRNFYPKTVVLSKHSAKINNEYIFNLNCPFYAQLRYKIYDNFEIQFVLCLEHCPTPRIIFHITQELEYKIINSII